MTTAPQPAKTKPYKRFDNRKAVFQLPPNAFKLWMYHYSRENSDNESWPSRNLIVRETGMSLDTVNKARAYLIENGWLRKVGERRSLDGRFAVPVFSVDEGTIPCTGSPDTERPCTVNHDGSRDMENRTPTRTENNDTDAYGFSVQEVDSIKKERVLADALQDFKNFSQSVSEPEGVNFEIEEQGKSMPERIKSDGEKAATRLWNLLGGPSEFQNAESVKDWTQHMRDCMGEAEMELEEFLKFLHWVVKEHSYSAEWMSSAKNPAASLSKNMSGLLRRYRGEQNAKAAVEKKKKEREAAKVQNNPNLPAYRQESGKREILKGDV